MESHFAPTLSSELYLLNNQSSIHSGFVTQAQMEQEVISESVVLAKEANLAILSVGNITQWETEGQDMSCMTLPADGSQDQRQSAGWLT